MAFKCNLCFNNPSKNEAKIKSKRIDKELEKDNREYKRQIKLLLLGPGESGKSTFMKQMKIINGVEFTSNEINEYKLIIYQNIIRGTQILLDARSKLNINWKNPDSLEPANLLSKFTDYLNLSQEVFQSYASAIKILWNDPSLKETAERKMEYQIGDSVFYYLDNLERISNQDYVPTHADILHCRKATKCIVEHVINIHGHPFRFVDVGGQRSQRQKWVQCFEGVTSIIFVVDSSSFDEYLPCPLQRFKGPAPPLPENTERPGKKVTEDDEDLSVRPPAPDPATPSLNKLDEARAIFETIVNNRFFTSVSIVLFLNKTDLLEAKVRSAGGSDISRHFPRFGSFSNGATANGPVPDPSTDPARVQAFILDLFLSVRRDKSRPLFHHYTTAIDTTNIERVFRAVKNTVLDKNLQSLMLA